MTCLVGDDPSFATISGKGANLRYTKNFNIYTVQCYEATNRDSSAVIHLSFSKRTYTPKNNMEPKFMEFWNMIFLFKQAIFRFHFSFCVGIPFHHCKLVASYEWTVEILQESQQQNPNLIITHSPQTARTKTSSVVF